MSIARAASRAARFVLWSVGGLLAVALAVSWASPVFAQSDCPTNYCIKSQSVSFQTPAQWPNVEIAPCCRTQWGTAPGGIDWPNAKPIMICTGNGDYATTFPNCGDPNNMSQAFPLSYDRPKIGIGVAWPNPKNYRYAMESVPIIEGADGTCTRFSHQPGKLSDWWVHELADPKLGSYVFTATVSFRPGDKGYVAVLDNCKLAPPPPARTQ